MFGREFMKKGRSQMPTALVVTVVFSVLNVFLQNFDFFKARYEQGVDKFNKVRYQQHQNNAPQYYFDHASQRWYCYYNNQWWVYNPQQ
jgi:arylamine N-acetyltransferase